jgi:hypothetical protein
MLEFIDADFSDGFDAALERESGIIKQDSWMPEILNHRSVEAADLII